MEVRGDLVHVILIFYPTTVGYTSKNRHGDRNHNLRCSLPTCKYRAAHKYYYFGIS